MFRHQLVFVADALELLGAVNEQDRVVRFRFLQDDDAGGDGGAEKEVGRELDDGVDVVVVDEVLADLAFGAATVQDAGNSTIAAVPLTASRSMCMVKARSAFERGARTPAGE